MYVHAGRAKATMVAQTPHSTPPQFVPLPFSACRMGRGRRRGPMRCERPMSLAALIAWITLASLLGTGEEKHKGLSLVSTLCLQLREMASPQHDV